MKFNAKKFLQCLFEEKPVISLPQPDRFGNFWVAKGNKKYGPAILRSNTARGGYLVYLGRDRGFLWEGIELARFCTAIEAAEALEATWDK